VVPTLGVECSESLPPMASANRELSDTPSVIIDAQPMPMPHPGSPARVLIVDDDATNRMVLREQLSEAGYQWVEAEDGIDGLEKFQTEGPFDCVLLDVMMPRMNGLQACSQLRLNYNKTELPVFMLSAKVQTRDIVAGFDAGANDYLPKPFAKVELLARLHTHIGDGALYTASVH
ncbi:MAG: response regulator, partial [Betaproteobacteria bacterium]|nr:response regulator [Betaproteobacteria bacterium]